MIKCLTTKLLGVLYIIYFREVLIWVCLNANWSAFEVKQPNILCDLFYTINKISVKTYLETDRKANSAENIQL